MFCKRCGAELSDGVKFCGKCGYRVEEPLEKKVCQYCGSSFTNAEICPGCGASISLQDHTNPQNVNTPPIIQDTTSLQTSPPNNVNVVNTANERAQSVSATAVSNTGKRSIVTVIIVCAIALTALSTLVAVVKRAIGINDSSYLSGRNTVTDLVVTREKIVVIDVTNLTYPEAVNSLKEAGFTNISSDIDSNVSEDQWVVIDQSVAAGNKIYSDENIELICAKKCHLYLDISSYINLFFDKYSISISVDETEVGKVENGEEFTCLIDVISGEHTILFCKEGSSSPKVSKTLTISEDTTYTCKLSHSAFSIDISNESIENNVNKASLEVVDVTEIPLSEAKTILSNIGFSNIRGEPRGDIWEEANWIVVAQNIAPGSHVDKNEYIQLDCVRATNYFDGIFAGKNISECLNLADGAWYKLVFKDKSLNILDASTMSDETKANWVGTSTSYGRVNKEVCIYVEYVGPTATPTPTSIPKPTTVPRPTTAPKPTSAPTSRTTSSADFHSSNDMDIAKDGNTGVYAYKNMGGNYDIYWIIDFDEGYVYYFTDGNGEASCDRVKIVSGDLNSYVLITYDDGSYSWDEALSFKWKRQPDHLVCQDSNYYSYDFYSTNLDNALAVRDTKTIVD